MRTYQPRGFVVTNLRQYDHEAHLASTIRILSIRLEELRTALVSLPIRQRYSKNRDFQMPYQVLPGLAVISIAFSLMGVGFGAVNKWQARNNMQVR